MASPRAPVGCYLPYNEMEVDPIVLRDFAQAVEAMGYRHIAIADHVLGANRASRPDWNFPYDSSDTFFEPLIAFAYLTGVTKAIALLSGVVVAPQRQAVLLAKQAATLDVLCGGRLKLGLGTGWNALEFEALGMSFDDRGARFDEQIAVMRRLWTEQHVAFEGRYHRIDDAGLAPMPVQRPIPIILAGNARIAMDRAARIGDGWMPHLSSEGADDKIGRFHEAIVAAGRDPRDVPLYNLVHLGTGGTFVAGTLREPEDVVRDVEIWQRVGVGACCVNTMERGLFGVEAHLTALRLIAEMLGLEAYC